jgi:hypothetical protein
MLIDLLSKSRQTGYLGKELEEPLSFFSNNTLCLRRSALDSLGTYDEDCLLSEDVEICARISQSSWSMFLCAEMKVGHRARPTIPALLEQWWGYGRFVPYVYNKYNGRHLEIFVSRDLQFFSKRKGEYRNVLYKENWPLSICIFVTPFLVFHVIAALALLLMPFLPGLSAVLLLPAAWALFEYLKPDLPAAATSFKETRVALARYLVNCAFFLSHVLNGWRHNCLYLPPVISERSLKQAEIAAQPDFNGV